MLIIEVGILLYIAARQWRHRAFYIVGIKGSNSSEGKCQYNIRH